MDYSNLRRFFKTPEEYNNFMNILSKYLEQYYFLKIDFKIQKNVFENAIIEEFTKDYIINIENVKTRIKAILSECIGLKIKNNDISIFENILRKKLENGDDYKIVIKNFLNDLKILEIPFTEEIFNSLKLNSKLFSFILEKLKLSKYDFKKFVEKFVDNSVKKEKREKKVKNKKTIYSLINDDTIILEEKEKIVDLVVSSFSLEDKRFLIDYIDKKIKKTDENKKKYVRLRNKLKREYIYYKDNNDVKDNNRKFKKVYDIIDDDTVSLDKKQIIVNNILNNWDKDDKQLLLDYIACKYNYLSLEYSEIKRLIISLKREYVYFIEKENKQEDKLSIYDLIEDESINISEKKCIIDELLLFWKKEDLQFIEDCLESKCSKGHKFSRLILKLKNQYDYYKENKTLINTVNKRNSIYDYVVDEFVSDELKIKVIDNILNDWPIEDQQIINDYFCGKVSSNSKENKKFYYLVKKLRKHYNKKIIEVYLIDCVKDDLSNLERKKIIDKIISSWSVEARKVIKDYSLKDTEYFKNLVIRLENEYSDYLKEMKKKNKDYVRFIDDENSSVSEKKKIVKIILNTWTKEEQQLLLDYNAGKKVDNSKFYRLINKLRREYKFYLEHKELKLVHDNKKFFYNYFVEYNISKEEKINIINHIVEYLSEEEKSLIESFIYGKFSINSYDGKRFSELMETLKDKYKNYKFNNLKNKTLSDLIMDDNLDKEFIINYLLNRLPLDRQTNLNLYLKGQVLVNSADGIQAKCDKEFIINEYNYLKNIGVTKIKLLFMELKYTEYTYRNYGYSSEEYNVFFNRVMNDILCNNPDIEIQFLIKKYVEIANTYLRKPENKLNRK